VCTGYYLVRLKAGIDIRKHGSGGVGARNVGRMLGKSGFIITLLGDAVKGLLAVFLARQLGAAEEAVALVFIAVIAGHIWPVFLQFKGGRGIATAIGAYLVYDSTLALMLLVVTSVLLVFRKGFIISGLAAFLLLPFIALVLDFPIYSIGALAGSSGIILFAHRKRIRKFFTETRPQKET